MLLNKFSFRGPLTVSPWASRSRQSAADHWKRATSSARLTARDRLFTRLFARLAGKGSHDLSQHPLFFL